MTQVPSFRIPPAPVYVRPGDTIVWFGKPTLRSAASILFGLAFTLLFLFITTAGGLLTQGGPFAYALPVAFLLLVGIIALVVVARLRRAEYVITRTGVYARTGLIGTTVGQTTFDKITDLEVRQDVLGRLLGYGSLQVNTAGSSQAPIHMQGLADPLLVKTLVERAKAERSERPGAREPARGLPTFTPSDQIALFHCPACKKSFPRPRMDAGRRTPCPHCHVLATLKEVTRARGRR